MSVHSLLKPALLASALGTLLAIPAANAQDNGRYSNAAYSNDNETVTVTAPNFRVQRGTFGTPQKVSLSRAVPYDDLDLRTPQDARALRQRVAETARDICDQLADAYPGPEASGTSCYRSARADEAIRDARE
ncbi:MAG TPA: UrcA family protein [Rhizomicrobium sp.]